MLVYINKKFIIIDEKIILELIFLSLPFSFSKIKYINLKINFLFELIFYYLFFKYIYSFGFHWGLGIGDWGLGIGDWGLGPIPNTQFANPDSPTPIPLILR